MVGIIRECKPKSNKQGFLLRRLIRSGPVSPSSRKTLILGSRVSFALYSRTFGTHATMSLIWALSKPQFLRIRITESQFRVVFKRRTFDEEEMADSLENPSVLMRKSTNSILLADVDSSTGESLVAVE